MSKTKEKQHKGLHLHRTHPILFGGNPTDRQNITFVTRLQHAELATFWNRKLGEMKNHKNERTV
ncbi:MAG: hypothetical protein QM802_05115 [Agriterribacter sp.]